MKPIKTERLVIQQLTEDDAAFLLELMNEPSYIQNIGDRNVRTSEDAKKFITEKYLTSYLNNGFGLFAVKLLESGTPVGICGLVKRDFLIDIDIGFAFSSRHWGKGYALESALAVRDFARDVVKLNRLIGICLPTNKPSSKVLEKIGMTFEKSFIYEGDKKENCLYGMKL